MCAALFGLMFVCSTMTLARPIGTVGQGRHRSRVEHGGRESGPVEVEVDVARAFDGDPVEPRWQVHGLDQTFRNRARRLAEFARDVKSAGTRDVAQPPLGRYFDGRVVIEPEDAERGRFAARRRPGISCAAASECAECTEGGLGLR